MKYFLSIFFFTLNLFSFEETFKREISAKEIEKIIVENVNGNIEISGEERENIEIEAIKKAERQAHLKNLKIDIKKTGRDLNIKTEHTRSYFLGFIPVQMGGSVNYKIRIPRDIKLKIETVNGNISIENILSFIEAESVNGDINLKEISGNGTFETVNGNIKIKIKSTSPNLSAESVNGSIYLISEEKINAKYYFEVVNGKIKIIPSIMEIKSTSPKEISGILGDGKGKINIETVNGNITIEEKAENL